MAKLVVNGEVQEVNLPLTLTELIKKNGVSHPDMVSVQINGVFIVREKYGETTLREGDEVDFLYFMGGGKS
ncbi:MAG: sulfur carrier protein ThiS [Tannerellaceae bacterium]|jgi:sulfur carrier protein|nr:sulfur carrier protein ThiS [Tannerellaceae bacterium]